MAQRPQDSSRNAVAFVTHTRDYRSSDVLPALARNGFTTTERPHDRETERLLKQFDPDLVVLAVDPRLEVDLDLVGSVVRSTDAVVFVLSPGPHVLGMATALQAGADVCLRESDGAELINAQISSLARRRLLARAADDAAEDDQPIITVRDVTLDFDRCQAVREDERIPLTPTEFKILAFLAKNAGKVVSPVEILRAVQEYTYSEREAQEIVKVYIRRIRRKVEADPAKPTYIVNVRGFGYMLERRGTPRASDRQAAA
jgi:DNA-binding response OmpR family regulator